MFLYYSLFSNTTSPPIRCMKLLEDYIVKIDVDLLLQVYRQRFFLHKVFVLRQVTNWLSQGIPTEGVT